MVGDSTLRKQLTNVLNHIFVSPVVRVQRMTEASLEKHGVKEQWLLSKEEMGEAISTKVNDSQDVGITG